MKCYRIINIIFIFFILFIVILSNPALGCKDIIACGDSTLGDFNLLMKVRDPSRPGLQVLCMVPEGYTYEYYHPKSGESLVFKSKHKYIGIATLGDTIPNYVKPGMALTDVGLGFGDADTNSNWINHRKYAWDDFDWIRYACEKADNEEEAVMKMTEEVVDELHATGTSENLFIIGPKTGYIIEADAYHYDIKEIKNDVAVMSNYPKELWKSQLHKKLPISLSFDSEKKKSIRRGKIVRLNSIYGVKILKIYENSIIIRQVPFIKIIDKNTRFMGNRVEILKGERKTVGDFSVEVKDIIGKKAVIRVTNKYKAWEEKMMEYIDPRYGSITVKDMMNWSRLNYDDLDGLRPMCEKIYDYEAVSIFKIPLHNYEVLSSGWFAPNHASSSIYVPFHICDNSIYEPYVNGEAAKLALDIYKSNLGESLTEAFIRTEDVFLYENTNFEDIACDLISMDIDISNFLNIIDVSMQKQAMLVQRIWMDINNSKNRHVIESLIQDIWDKNYSNTISNLEITLKKIDNDADLEDISDRLIDITLEIGKFHINAAKSIDRGSSAAEIEFNIGSQLLNESKYTSGFDHIKKAYKISHSSLNDASNPYIIKIEKKIESYSDLITISIIILSLLILIIFFAIKKFL